MVKPSATLDHISNDLKHQSFEPIYLFDEPIHNRWLVSGISCIKCSEGLEATPASTMYTQQTKRVTHRAERSALPSDLHTASRMITGGPAQNQLFIEHTSYTRRDCVFTVSTGALTLWRTLWRTQEYLGMDYTLWRSVNDEPETREGNKPENVRI